jgi:hypothetical protein
MAWATADERTATHDGTSSALLAIREGLIPPPS